jgi:hypothetical protein
VDVCCQAIVLVLAYGVPVPWAPAGQAVRGEWPGAGPITAGKARFYGAAGAAICASLGILDEAGGRTMAETAVQPAHIDAL